MTVEKSRKNRNQSVGIVPPLSSYGRSERNEELTHVQNHPLPVVRRRGRGGRKILRFAVAGFQNRNSPEEYRRWSGRKGRHGAGGGIHAGRPAFHGAQRRHAVRIYSRDLIQDRLRRSGRGRSPVGHAVRRWRVGRTMRLAQGPFWRVLADRAIRIAAISRRARSRRRGG